MAPSNVLRKTAHAVVNGYNDWTMESIMAPRTKDCVQKILPESLGRPAMRNEEYIQYFGTILPHFRDFKVSIKDMIIDDKQNKVIMHATSTAEMLLDVPSTYTNEYMLYLTMTEDGTQVSRIDEFVDSAESTKQINPLMRYILKKSKQGKL